VLVRGDVGAMDGDAGVVLRVLEPVDELAGLTLVLLVGRAVLGGVGEADVVVLHMGTWLTRPIDKFCLSGRNGRLPASRPESVSSHAIRQGRNCYHLNSDVHVEIVAARRNVGPWTGRVALAMLV